MLPENDGEQSVDRGDEYDSSESAGKIEESSVETNLNQEDSGDEAAAAAAVAKAELDKNEESDKAAAEEIDDKGRDEKGRFIPKERFDEAVQRERDEKSRIASRLHELERREADRAISENVEEAAAAIKTLIGEHTTLISDGELDKASEKMSQIIQLQGNMQERRAAAMATASATQAKSEVQYDAVVARLEMDYPEINPEDTENFDRESVRRVQAYMTGLIQMDSMTPSMALQEAVSTILGAKRAEQNQTDADKQKEADAEGLRRKEAAVKKNVDAQGKQPANLKDVGQDHDKEGGSLDAAAVMKMSWEEFVKLPEEKLSEMRGDHV